MNENTASGKTGVSRDAGPESVARKGKRGSRRAHVLRQRGDFEAVLRTGWRLASQNFVLRAGPNDISQARLGIIAGKKVAPRSVDRNRARRLIREAFRSAAPHLGAYDITIQLRSDLRSELNGNVRVELEKLLHALVLRTTESHEQQADRQ